MKITKRNLIFISIICILTITLFSSCNSITLQEKRELTKNNEERKDTEVI